jgi:hypothetical protein
MEFVIVSPFFSKVSVVPKGPTRKMMIFGWVTVIHSLAHKLYLDGVVSLPRSHRNSFILCSEQQSLQYYARSTKHGACVKRSLTFHFVTSASRLWSTGPASGTMLRNIDPGSKAH